jgi:tetratricopeptide (TPR) repeat protein
MLEKTIEHIAYQLKQNKAAGEPGAIVFIGAGCSVSAGIPSADTIVNYVLENYKDNPDIKCFSGKPKYAELMECLGPRERNRVFKHYVEAAKINVSHIYLAHLMANSFVDYIVTVNFDNLAQRALALYNIFPPTYDISILKDLTTTSLDTKSITYLHGQYNGLWQLNTKEEMRKVIDSNVANTIFNKISNNRPWIVVGYSGDDFIFDQLVKLGRFDNGLYWVGYKDNEPTIKVKTDLLDKPNTESFWVKDYDADSFFLKLNAELKNENPKIFDVPFSFLSELQDGIIDIDESEEYKSVKERFDGSKKMVIDAINRYENAEEDTSLTNNEIEVNKLRKDLINCLIDKNYEELAELENNLKGNESVGLFSIVSDIYSNWGNDIGKLAKIKSDEDTEAMFQLSFEKFNKAIEMNPDNHKAYNNWGIYLGKLAEAKSDKIAEELYNQAFEKFSKAIEIKPDKHEAYFNWGTYLGYLAKTKSGAEAETLYLQALEKYSKAIEVQPNYHEAYNNWGTYLGNLAKTKSGAEAEELYLQAFEKFNKAIEIKPNSHQSYFSWGTYLGNLAKTKSDAEAESLYLQAFEKYSKAIEIQPNDHDAYNNWGSDLGNLAEIKSGNEAEELYLRALEKYSKSIEIEPDKHDAYNNYGNCLMHLAKTKSGIEADVLFTQAFEKLNKAIDLGGSSYNLACSYALTNRFDEAFILLEKCLQNNETTFEFVENDTDWDQLRAEPQYEALKQRFLK